MALLSTEAHYFGFYSAPHFYSKMTSEHLQCSKEDILNTKGMKIVLRIPLPTNTEFLSQTHAANFTCVSQGSQEEFSRIQVETFSFLDCFENPRL